MVDSHVPALEASYLPSRNAAGAGTLLKRLAPAAAACLVAILLRSITNLGEDCSWLLTLGEKFLAGATPYVEFIEVNPPASFLMYLPAILLARVLGVSPESAVVGLMFTAVPASLALTTRILGELRHRAGEPLFLAVAVLVLSVVPNHSFGQREHVAVVAVLPMLAACARARAGTESRPSTQFWPGSAVGLRSRSSRISRSPCCFPWATSFCLQPAARGKNSAPSAGQKR